MKKLLIAGYETQTAGYRSAFSLLGACADPLAFPPERHVSGPLRAAQPDIWSMACLYDGLVLPGGGDISPALLHCPNMGSRNIDEPLDHIQFSLLYTFIEAGKPVLGICKGLQVINAGFGGTIRQDLCPASLDLHAWEGRDRIHRTKAAKGTFLYRLYGSRPLVNSAHHQAAGSIGQGLRVAQYAEDFVVEALYHERLPVFAVQWHPERLCFSQAKDGMEDGSRLLSYFLSLL